LDKDYKGSAYNVLIQWETLETTYEVIVADYPVTCTEYAKLHDLLSTPGWKRIRRIAKKDKRLSGLSTKNSGRLGSWYHEITHSTKNGNTMWQDAETTEMRQLLEYQTFVDKGIGGTVPAGYKKIQIHMIYDVKHDVRHKAHLVEAGHMTAPNTKSVISGVVSLRGIRLVVFLAKLNTLELCGAAVEDA
jgi:hypothetical protein